MTVRTSQRPVSVDELAAAWRAVQAGDFRDGSPRRTGPRGRGVREERRWSPAEGEHCVAVLGCAGSSGASTLALALATVAAVPARVVECCSITASGLAGASTAELGPHPSGWRQGRRDHVLIERIRELLTGLAEVPVPPPAAEAQDGQVTVLDVGWELGALMATDCWLRDAVHAADQRVLVTTATTTGFRRAGVAIELVNAEKPTEDLTLAVQGPRRKKWPRGLENAGGALVRQLLDAGRYVEVPIDRELSLRGLDSRPLGDVLLASARRLLDPTHLSTENESA